MKLSYGALEQIAAQHGLMLLGVKSIAVLRPESDRLRIWQDEGYGGEMAYMRRAPELLTQPERLLPQARSIASFSMRYAALAHPERTLGHGRVARYAWGRDYHEVLPDRLNGVLSAVAKALGEMPEARVFSDAVPMLERAVAAKTGSVFVGKNTMCIRPKVGSYFFLAEIVWNLEVFDAPCERQAGGHCGSCTRCLQQCPTRAFVAPYVLDARRCISYLSIEKRGDLTVDERMMLGEWVFGCDVCQEVCPFNARSKEGAYDDNFSAQRGVGPLIDLAPLFEIRSTQQFRKRFEGTPLLRTKREGLLRNAACVAANTKSVQLLPFLEDAARSDPSPIVRKTSLWAYTLLGGPNKFLRQQRLKEDPIVVEEIDTLLEQG